MKKAKYIFSVFLTVALLLTTMVPLFVNAADVDLDALSKKILDLPTSISGTADAKAAQYANYEAVKTEYLLLTEEQKDSLASDVQKKIISISAVAFKYLYPNTAPVLPTADYNLKVHNGVIDWGIPTADMIAASDIAQMFYGTKLVPGTDVKLTKTASAIDFTVQATADAFSAALALYENSTDAAKGYLADVVSTAGYLIDGTTSVVPLNELLQVYGLYYFQTGTPGPDGYVATTAIRGQINAFKALNMSLDYNAIRDSAVEMMPFLDNFTTYGTINAEAYLPLLDKFNAMTPEELARIPRFGSVTVVLVGATQTATSITNLMNNYFPGLYHAQGILPLLDQLDESNIDNALLRQIKVYWESIPAGGRNYLIGADYRNKFNRVSPQYVPAVKQDLNTALANTDAFTRSSVNYPPYGKTRTELSLCTLEPLVTMITDLTVNDIGQMLYTNQLASSIVGVMATFDVPSAASMIGISLTPSAVAGQLTEPEYAEAKEYFASLGSKWDNFDASQVDWGFENGDKESFVNAVAAGLRRLTTVIMDYGKVTDNPNDTGNFGDYTYGKYETMLVPVLEALGCPDIVSTEEFLATASGDNLVKALLNPIFGLVEELMTAPLTKLLQLLPNLANGIVNGVFDELFAYKLLIAGYTINVVPANNMEELLGMIVESTGITLPQIDWEYLAGLGTITNNKASVSSRNAYRAYIVADKADVLSYLVQYMGEVFRYENNCTTIANMLTTALGTPVSATDMKDVIATCKSGNVVNAGKALIEFGKKLFARQGGDVSEIPGEPTEEPGTTNPGSSISAGDFFKRFIEFLKEAFNNYLNYFRNIFR